MKSGIKNEHRSRLHLREELGLPPSSTDMEVAHALLERVKSLEAQVAVLESRTIGINLIG